MVMWHTVFALSGQHWDAPSQALSFKPKMPSPFKLPVLLPGSVALLASDTAGLSLTVVAGKPVTLSQLAVGGRPAPALPKSLGVGQSVHWQ